jgi:uracil-DNA glycosylase
VRDLLPDKPTLPSVREISRGCKACDLYRRATQTVFGEGPGRAEIMLIGEQPRDAEDVAGHPFVGPAGRLLDRALEEAGIDRQRGEFLASSLAPLVTATVHPSSILRAPDDESRRMEMHGLVADLKKVAKKLGSE